MWRCCSYDDSTTSTSWRVRWVPHRSHAAPSRAGLTFRYRFDDPLEGHRSKKIIEKPKKIIDPKKIQTSCSLDIQYQKKHWDNDIYVFKIIPNCPNWGDLILDVSGCQWSSWSQGKALEGTLRGIEVPEPKTWSPEEPHLHRLKVGYLGGSFGCFFCRLGW